MATCFIVIFRYNYKLKKGVTMELFILLIIVFAILGLILFIKNKNQAKQLKECENSTKLLSTGNQQYEIELAKLNERVSSLPEIESKVEQLTKELKLKEIESQNLLNQKQDELTTLKEEYSKVKTSLTEQKEKYNDFKITSNTRLDEIKEELEQSKTINTTYNEEIKNNKSLISQLQTQLEEQNRSMEEKVKLLQNSEEKLKTQFKNIATEIFDSNSKKFSEQNQISIGHILKPMKEQLTDFKKKIEDVHTKDNEARGELRQELKMLKELNQDMTKEASNLTNALKGDSKKQGKWGEMVLENVLESSGLREGYEYKREVSLRDNEDKLFRPDVIVNLPDNRHIIIDAKTSLTAYSEYIASNDEADKQIYIKSHIKSVKDHIKGLSNKKYEDLKNVNSLDFIFMFVPIESALLLALEHDVNLYDEAFKQKIILVSPTTLLVALRAVENTWRYERQAQSIADVSKRAEELYKKFNGFVEDLKKVGKGLETANKSYSDAFDKLSLGNGNLVRQVTMLKTVSSIKPKKELDSVLVDGAMMDVLGDKEKIGEQNGK
jgi:DNA recombination protein RmuC